MFLVKLSHVAQVTPQQVLARLATEATSPDLAELPIRDAAEPVLTSAFAVDLDHAWDLATPWSKRGDVRAGRARVRIVEIPERGAR